jgi:hypothetical protein
MRVVTACYAATDPTAMPATALAERCWCRRAPLHRVVDAALALAAADRPCCAARGKDFRC